MEGESCPEAEEPPNEVPRKQQRAGGEAKGDTVDADVMDLATQVQLKLFFAQRESRVGDLEAATYCTLFLPQESDVVKEMHDAGRVCSELDHPRQVKRKSAHLVFVAMLKAIE